MDINNVNFEWNFNKLDVYPALGDKTNMVHNVHWELIATTGSYSSRNSGIIDIPYYEPVPSDPPDPNAIVSPWIEFQNLTKQEVQTWVENRMNAFNEFAVIQLKEKLAQEIEKQVNPPSVTVKSPWL